MEKLNVLIMDKSIFYKKILAQAVESTGLGVVKHTASNEDLARERLKQGKTDVVLMDLSDPNQFTENQYNLRKEHPGVFLILMAPSGSGTAAKKLLSPDAGVIGFIEKPAVNCAEKSVESIKGRLQGLFTQIMTWKLTSRDSGRALAKPSGQAEAPAKSIQPAPKKRLSGVDLVVMASSTGGPGALEAVCKDLPADFGKPILVVQHMPGELTPKMAQSLDRKCRLPVVEARDGDPVKPGRILIAPGGLHMTLQASAGPEPVVGLESTPPVNGVRPSADVLFRSVASAFRNRRILAVILTGMGSDGTLGLREMKKYCDCYCLTQSEKSCVVYGMPRSVVDAGLSDDAPDISGIAARILQISGRQRLDR